MDFEVKTGTLVQVGDDGRFQGGLLGKVQDCDCPQQHGSKCVQVWVMWNSGHSSWSHTIHLESAKTREWNRMRKVLNQYKEGETSLYWAIETIGAILDKDIQRNK